jgi:hypothetical protein
VACSGLPLFVRELWQARHEAIAEAARRRKERIVDATVGIAEASRTAE